ncbi:hypothetical protein BPT24_225 [Tenacibaculum phage pT24]|uniref:Uncharacterized protein n=1 Tax=Tenacibaculum phage pT24 TaxID=1880590 RepID=A0A1B4XX22_9CAUD|nr:hypothetical protein HYP10_gp225 [Tenacibaculum phage pT24]BAV39349.1 hypothetical protein BPT24_225 [Tenacibaculum phage pT24]
MAKRENKQTKKTLTVDTGLEMSDIENAKTIEETVEETVEETNEVETETNEIDSVVEENDNEEEEEEENEEVTNITNPYNLDDEPELRKYLVTSLNRMASNALESGNLSMNKEAIDDFVRDACSQCRYEDFEKAKVFAYDTIKKVSSTLLM